MRAFSGSELNHVCNLSVELLQSHRSNDFFVNVSAKVHVAVQRTCAVKTFEKVLDTFNWFFVNYSYECTSETRERVRL